MLSLLFASHCVTQLQVTSLAGLDIEEEVRGGLHRFVWLW